MTPERVMKRAIAALLRDRFPDVDHQAGAFGSCPGHPNELHEDAVDYCDGACVTGEPWVPPGDK